MSLIRRNTRMRMLIPVLLSLAYLAPSAVMPFLWIDLRSVTISDAPSAHEAMVDVDRSTRFGFHGTYHLTFRSAGDDLTVCNIAGPKFQYKGGLTKPIRKPLSWWTDGEEPLNNCAWRGLMNGRFYLDTCQDVLIFGVVSIARRCVRSNDFTLGDRP